MYGVQFILDFSYIPVFSKDCFGVRNLGWQEVLPTCYLSRVVTLTPGLGSLFRCTQLINSLAFDKESLNPA